jgi:hypothetical protein
MRHYAQYVCTRDEVRKLKKSNYLHSEESKELCEDAVRTIILSLRMREAS